MSLNASFVIILLGGWVFARLASLVRLPAIVGMVIFGIGCSVLIGEKTPPLLWEMAPFLKSSALIVILLRAGLGLNKAGLKKSGLTAVLMTFVPCLFEGAALTGALYWIFEFDFFTAGLTAFMLSAVSPAVIVPSMLDFKARGVGKEKDVPTLILAGASVDDVIAITLFSVFLGLLNSGGVDMAEALLSIPVSIGIGVISGIGVGFVLLLFFKKYFGQVRATEKLLVLLCCGTLLVQVGEQAHFAALIGIMTTGFILLEKSEKIAHELAAKLAKVWVFAEIILFVLIGYSLDVQVASEAGLKGVGVILIGLLFRSLGVWLATAFSSLNKKERLFCVLAYLPKATVQAALGGIALSHGLAHGEQILALAVVAILFTAPIGLIAIRSLGPRLLENGMERALK